MIYVLYFVSGAIAMFASLVAYASRLDAEDTIPLFPKGFRGCEYAKLEPKTKIIRVFGSKDYRLRIESPHTLKQVSVGDLGAFSEYQFEWSDT